MIDAPTPCDDAWEVALAHARDAMWQWRDDHARATFDEIEAAVDAAMQRARAQLVTEVAGRTDGGGDAVGVACPTCGQRLHARGSRTRTVLVAGEEPVTLRRAYLVCPGCGTGLFPPR